MGNPQKTVSRIHIPYDPELFTELNTPTYQLTKMGKIQYTHPTGTHDDRFWAIGLPIWTISVPYKNTPIFKQS